MLRGCAEATAEDGGLPWSSSDELIESQLLAGAAERLGGPAGTRRGCGGGRCRWPRRWSARWRCRAPERLASSAAPAGPRARRPRRARPRARWTGSPPGWPGSRPSSSARRRSSSAATGWPRCSPSDPVPRVGRIRPGHQHVALQAQPLPRLQRLDLADQLAGRHVGSRDRGRAGPPWCRHSGRRGCRESAAGRCSPATRPGLYAGSVLAAEPVTLLHVLLLDGQIDLVVRPVVLPVCAQQAVACDGVARSAGLGRELGRRQLGRNCPAASGWPR